MAEIKSTTVTDDYSWLEDGTIRLDETDVTAFCSVNGEALKSTSSVQPSDVLKEISNKAASSMTQLRSNIEEYHAPKRTSQRHFDHGQWSEAEDNWLISLVHRNGPQNWVRISQELGTKSPKQCRERYRQGKLGSKQDPVTAREGQQIERTVEGIGKRWAEIAQKLDEPSDDAVKNWWNGDRQRTKKSDHLVDLLSFEEMDQRTHPKPSPGTPDWGFLQNQQQQSTHDAISQECPSLTSGSNASSRNPSTRSTKSLRWQGAEGLLDDETEHKFVEKCPVSTCHRPFKDLKTHMLMHHVVRPEQCPITTCEYHTKSFSSTYDRLRHTSNHFTGTLKCGFCPITRTPDLYQHLDVFLQHLVSVHGVQQAAPSRRHDLDRMGLISEDPIPDKDQSIVVCSECSEPFDAQGLYEHLSGCVLSGVTQDCSERERLDLLGEAQGDEYSQPFTGLRSAANENESQPGTGLHVANSSSATGCSTIQVFLDSLGDYSGQGMPEDSWNSASGARVEGKPSEEKTLAKVKDNDEKRIGRSGDRGKGHVQERHLFQVKETHQNHSEEKNRQRPHHRQRSAMNGEKERRQVLWPRSARQPDDGIAPTDADVEELTASSRCLSLTSSAGIKSSSEEETDWTEDAPSPQSEPDATRVLSPLKRQLVDNIMQEFHRLVDLASYNNLQLSAQIRTHAGSNASGGTYSATQSSYGGSSNDSSSMSRKRSLSGGGSPPPNGEKNNGDDPHKRRRPDMTPQTKESLLPERRFACPYYKRNPGRHLTFTSCRDPGFITVARLKEHLYRRHLLPIQCHRCCSTFPNEPSLREHQRDPRGCEVQEQMPPEGFDKDQERRLKSKKRSLVYQSEEDKWKGVYRILFPDDNDQIMPSPYIEYQATGSSLEPSNIARFQEFSRLELPRLVRRTLEVVVEQEAQPLEEKMKERLVDIVKECQTQLFTMFQGVSGSSEEPISTTSPQQTMAQNPPPAHACSSLEGTVENETFPDFEVFSSGFIVPAASTSYAITDKNIVNTRRRTTSGPNMHSSDLQQKNPSDSPDSGYDSTWPTVPFQQDLGFNNAQFYSDNGQVNLSEYYGLWSTENHALNTADCLDSSTWAFADTNASADVIGLMASVPSTMTQ